MNLKVKHILVVGGAGFIGSLVNKMLHHAGYFTIVLDDLSTGNQNAVTNGILIKGDSADTQILDRIFTQYKIDAVLHFAALTHVGESVANPYKYYLHNVSKTLSLLDAMQRHAVKKFIYSSSAAVYGIPQQRTEVVETDPCHPINPYGRSKWMVEEILRDLDATTGLRYCALRYFNAAGGDPEGKIKNYFLKKENLIPILLNSLKQGTGQVTVYGTDYPTPDGTCVRDFVHIADLGAAHIKAMELLMCGASSSCYNLGSGKGFSVREVIAAVEKMAGKKIQVIEGERRVGDPPILIANTQKAKTELSWQPQFSLEDMVRHALQ